MEIHKLYNPLPDLKYGMWINPNTKTNYRHLPIDFGYLGMYCEVPRNFMSI